MMRSLEGVSQTAVCCFRPDQGDVQAARRSKDIDRQLKQDGIKSKKMVKLLLLGAGESGKSTFLKQMKIIHGVTFEDSQLREFRQIIYSNMIRGMRVLVDANRKLGLSIEHEENKLYGDQLLLFDQFSSVDSHNFCDFVPMLKSLWSDKGIQVAFDRRSEYQLTDSVAYFYENIERIAHPSYTPSQQDILYCRKTTKGIIEFPLTIENVPFLFVDVGGQRTQRPKWFQCFDSVTAILFLASSSEFDQVLLEDRTVNRLEESRNIFDTIINNRIFESVSFILFLNKMDLLADKVKRRQADISHYFRDFHNVGDRVREVVAQFSGDPFNLDDVRAFILYLFLSKQMDTSKPIYHHFTTAVDTKNIQFVFTSVKNMVLMKNLSDLMLD